MMTGLDFVFVTRGVAAILDGWVNQSCSFYRSFLLMMSNAVVLKPVLKVHKHTKGILKSGWIECAVNSETESNKQPIDFFRWKLLEI